MFILLTHLLFFRSVVLDKHTVKPSIDWKTSTVFFDEFTADPKIPYTLEQAMQNASSLVFEIDAVGETGWFELDQVEFLTPNSYPRQQQQASNSNNDNNGSGSMRASSIVASLGAIVGLVSVLW